MMAGGEDPPAVLGSWLDRPCQSAFSQQENVDPGFAASCSEGPPGSEWQGHGPEGMPEAESTAGDKLNQEGSPLPVGAERPASGWPRAAPQPSAWAQHSCAPYPGLVGGEASSPSPTDSGCPNPQTPTILTGATDRT